MLTPTVQNLFEVLEANAHIKPPKLPKRRLILSFSSLPCSFSTPANSRHIRLGRGEVPLQGGFRRGPLQELLDQPHGHR